MQQKNTKTEASILAVIYAHAKKNGYTVFLTEDAYENKRALNGKTNGKVILLSMRQLKAVEEEIAAEWYGTAKTIDLERFVKQEVKKDPALWEKIKNKLREIVGDIMTRLTKLAKGNRTMANALKIAEADRVRITEFTELLERELVKNAERSGTEANVQVSEKDAGTENYSIALTRTMEFEDQINQVEHMTLNGSNSL